MALTQADVKDLLLEIGRLSGEAFDAVEADPDALMDDLKVVARLADIDHKIEEVLGYVFVQNTLRMHAFGVDPRNAPGYQEAAQRFLGPLL